MVDFEENELVLIRYYDDEVTTVLRFRERSSIGEYLFDCVTTPSTGYIIIPREFTDGLVKIVSRGGHLELLYGYDRKNL